MSLLDLVDAIATRYVTVDQVLYRLESVTGADLAAAGAAYIAGIAAHVAVADAEEDAAVAGGEAAMGASPEQVAAKLRQVRDERARTWAARHAAAVREPGAAESYVALCRAYVVASVTGMGRSPAPAPRLAPGLPGIEMHPAGWAPPEEVLPCRIVVEDAPPSADQPAALRAHAAAGRWPLWALEDAAVIAIGQAAQTLAGGRAGIASPFRLAAGPAPGA